MAAMPRPAPRVAPATSATFPSKGLLATPVSGLGGPDEPL
jgi:hypothetical protein